MRQYKTWRRRDFIKSLSLGTAAGLAGGLHVHKALAAGGMGGGGMGGGGMGGGMGGGGGGMGGGGGGVIDPPVSGLYKDPVNMPNLSSTSGVVQVEVRAQLSNVNINGATAQLMTYNGSYPAPTIRVKRYDTLKVRMINQLPATTQTNMLGFQKNFTNLHTHGFHVSPKDPSDFMMYELAPGQFKDHVYDTSLHEAGTVCLYHPHKHGLVAEQYWAGLMGAIVVEDETPALANYETHLMILKDITISGGQPAPHSMMMDYMQGKEGNVVMVNGQVNPRLYAKNRQVQRWRIVNASNARFYRLALESHSFYLIGTDGGLLDKPYPITEILLSPAERVDLLVVMNKGSGNYRLRALPYSRMGMMTSPTITLLTLSYSGSVSPAQTLPSIVNSEARRINPASVDIMAEQTLSLSMGMGRGYINGMDFDVDPYMWMSQVDSYELWTIRNDSNMDHPFHQHVNAGQVVSITGGDAKYANIYTTAPAWKDVVLIPKGGSATILLPILDYDGMCMFHCHILEHEDIGMMGMWEIMNMMM
jgi:FtsP/CotA-like multicopper oxidase with cupredoxin domain